jgi:two-component system, NarL family, response regulator NreC
MLVDVHTDLSLVLVDDHAVVRAGLRHVLESQAGWTVAAEAATLEQGLEAVAEREPDVLVLDLHLKGASGLGAIPEFLQCSPGTSIVILTMEADPAFAREALRSGARAYVLKDSAESELVTAIRAAVGGDTYLSPKVGARLAAGPAAELGDLSAREQEVLKLLALGHTNSEIADKLFLSRRTVETHRANVQRKLGLSTRAELTRHVLEHHLIPV